MRTDFELLDAWRGGDKMAGGELFDRHFDSLFRFFAYKLPGEAEDLVQKTLLACVEAKGQFRKDAQFKTYLFRVARNKLYDSVATRHRERPMDPTTISIADQAETPSLLIARDEDQLVLVQALRRLPLELQVLIELRFFEAMRGPQLAEVLGLPLGTVRSRLRRAVARLRELVEAQATSSDAVQPTVTRLQTWAGLVRQASDLGEGAPRTPHS